MALYSTYIGNIKNLDEEHQAKVLNIARYFKSEKIKKDVRLSPTADLLKAIKTGNIDWSDFEYYYKEEMKREPMITALRELYKRLRRGEDIILVSYNKNYQECPRRLIGEFLQQYGIEYKELEPGEFTCRVV